MPVKPISRKAAGAAPSVWIWLAPAIMALGIFLGITTELFEGKIGKLDRSLLLAIAGLRTPRLTAIAIHMTALGSTRVLAWCVAMSLAALLIFREHNRQGRDRQTRGPRGSGRRRREILQLLTASIGGGLLTLATKSMIERPRPEVIPRLIQVTGSSYPSGHSLGATAVYLTIAILIAGRLEARWARVAVLAAAALIVASVALSRLYLGVHYPSDATAGVALGAGWAFLVAGGFAEGRHRGSGRS